MYDLYHTIVKPIVGTALHVVVTAFAIVLALIIIAAPPFIVLLFFPALVPVAFIVFVPWVMLVVISFGIWAV
jgi:hypothetical protein